MEALSYYDSLSFTLYLTPSTLYHNYCALNRLVIIRTSEQ